MHPLSGNKLVRDTLTCYEREVGSAQPTVAAGLQRSGSGSDSDSDDGEASTLLQAPEFNIVPYRVCVLVCVLYTHVC